MRRLLSQRFAALVMSLFLPGFTVTAMSATWGVHGHDDRIRLSVDETAWSAVGRLEWHPAGQNPKTATGKIRICTGSLVWRDLVLTNAHCLLQRKTGKLRADVVWFRAGLRGSRVLSQSKAERVWLGTTHPDTERRSDWALVRLKKPLGDELGWFDVYGDQARDNAEGGSDVSFVSYSSDFFSGLFPAIQNGCSLRGALTGQTFLRHNCDMSTGASGAPLFRMVDGKPRIVAINAAYLKSPYTNVAVSADRFRELLTNLRR